MSPSKLTIRKSERSGLLGSTKTEEAEEDADVDVVRPCRLWEPGRLGGTSSSLIRSTSSRGASEDGENYVSAEEHVEERDESSPLTMQQALTELGYDFPAIYEGFMAANTVMDYREHSAFTPVALRETVTSLPAEGTVDDERRPQSQGQDYIHIDLDQIDEEKPDLLVRFDGDAQGQWRVVLVGTVWRHVVETVSVDVVDGVGKGRLSKIGMGSQ